MTNRKGKPKTHIIEVLRGKIKVGKRTEPRKQEKLAQESPRKEAPPGQE